MRISDCSSDVCSSDLMPPVPQEERDAMPRRELLGKVLQVGLPPIGLVIAVLGSIIAGIAAPTEAASMGAVGSILVVVIARRFTWTVLRAEVYSTTRITATMFFVLICAQLFALPFRGLHGTQRPDTRREGKERGRTRKT